MLANTVCVFLLFLERVATITSYGAVHHCHHYYWGADSCADCQWTDPAAGELYSGTFDKVCHTINNSAVRSQVTGTQN